MTDRTRIGSGGASAPESDSTLGVRWRSNRHDLIRRYKRVPIKPRKVSREGGTADRPAPWQA